ncbi:TetR/AcrR family transcriptional regulator, transcriptional repressor for nem operon [Actinopolymorpha cephalotaxi]|uniref:TetR/AcrR family transcriptional regulator, transcriptional repressor for nem operon n=1 Tax=Actinopolymorpha cephalotaxi TaxID=504797 RepID=A0A1I2RJF1_9ACTN|nr:TetR/AcrR family transcriptional regulator [Actinopolymorpha cephalotaxi]NYH82286.1 TetR/AcrR family transcriptional repressor of nem operon [Actinopolymorpha cephalotaxi]SFG37896.1 TetR/AcrR family transcriptional regulator, transcriptional repressor for nem operon [Actinopolymorpha cephalotaxi]
MSDIAPVPTRTRGRPPGRPRCFDPGAALDAAVEAFLARGYHATSLTDLTTATGLHRGSLYAAFGDKHALFLAALRRHAERSLAALDATVTGAPSPLEGVARFVRDQAERAAGQLAGQPGGQPDGQRGGRGCLVANTTLELLPGDHEVAREIEEYQRRMAARVARALDEARAAGELTGPGPTAALARYLFVVVEGMWQLGRTTNDTGTLLGVADVALTTLTARTCTAPSDANPESGYTDPTT